MSLPLVSVVIPAHNAEKTVLETLGSVLKQSYENLEVIVVDDGSTDGTCARVQSLAATDARIRVISQAKSGVAAARNAGIALASGTYIAPLDADDLWHPKRVQLHVEALEAAGVGTAAAYSPFYRIDEDGKAIAKSTLFNYTGDVFLQQLERNLVGNGSGMTARRDCVLSVGGYSTSLHKDGAQGCEDYLLQLELAYRYRYVCVPQYLVGYRVAQGTMSSDPVQMLCSQLHMYAYLKSKYGLGGDAVGRHASEILWSLVQVIHQRKGKLAAGREIFRWVRNFREVTHMLGHISEFVLLKLGRMLHRFPDVGFTIASRMVAGGSVLLSDRRTIRTS
jgi:glycosyltransferase involved in cell wall biosynthesis